MRCALGVRDSGLRLTLDPPREIVRARRR